MQMKYSRWLISMVLIVAGLGLVACAAPAAAPAGDTAAADDGAPEPVTLTYWTGAPGEPLEPAMDALVAQFEEAHPWITINVEAFGFGEYFQKLDTATAGGSAPDVFWIDVTNIDSYVYYDTIVPLTDFVDDNYADDWFSIPAEDMYRGDELWAIALHQSTEAMVYNQDIIDAAGLTPPTTYADAWSFDEFRAALETVTAEGADGTTDVWGWTTQYPPGIYNLQPWMYAAGATFLDEGQSAYAGNTNSDKAVEAFTWYASLFQDGLSPIDRIPDIFQTGKVAFIQTNPFVLVDIQNRYPDLNFGVMPMPCDERCAVQSGAWHIGIHAQSEHPDEAWMLIDFLTNPEGHQQWVETSGYMPARKSAFEAMDKLQEYPWNVFMEGLIDHAVHRPGNIVWPIFNSELTSAAKNVATGADPKAELDRVTEIADTELANFE